MHYQTIVLSKYILQNATSSQKKHHWTLRNDSTSLIKAADIQRIKNIGLLPRTTSWCGTLLNTGATYLYLAVAEYKVGPKRVLRCQVILAQILV